MKKIKRLNPVYLAIYILVPVALVLAGGWVAKHDISENLFLVLIIAAIVCALAGNTFIGKLSRKKMDKALDAQGFSRNYIFNDNSKKLVIDQEHKQIALNFDWNPFEYFVIPAGRIEKAWTDDGKAGTNLLKSTNYVRFCFLLEGKRYNVYTFRSNRGYSYKSEEILEAVSKADMYVAALETAKTGTAAQEN